MKRMPLSEKVKQATFLEAYGRLGALTFAADETGIPRDRHGWWMEQDAEYPYEFRKAEKRAVEVLEREARRRAVEGVEEPIFWQGQQVGSVRKYSDSLLIFLLKGHKPETYRDYVTVTVDINTAAEAVAQELGLDKEAVLAEAERLVRLEG